MYTDNFNINDYNLSRKLDSKFPLLFLPDTKLRPYIYCYWFVIHTGTKDEAEKLAPKSFILIPDGGSSLVFDVNPDESRDVCNVLGVMDSPKEVFNQLSISKGKMRTFGVDFKPAGCYRFFNTPMNNLKNLSIKLEDISEKIFIELKNNILNAGSIGELLRITDTFFINRLADTKEIHPILVESLKKIFQNAGTLNIRSLTDDLSISERNLNRLFHKYVGLPPKLFCRITRLQNAIRLCKNGSQSGFLMAAYDSGYFDQAHFLKDFREFCGSTPGAFFQKNS